MHVPEIDLIVHATEDIGTYYYVISEKDALISSLQVAWSAGADVSITLYSSDWADPQGGALYWQDESAAVPWTGTGGVAGADGSELKHLGNMGARHLRLKIVIAADDSEFWIWRHGKQ